MNLKERSIIFVTFLIACWALALTAGGLGTRYWVVSSAVRLDSNLRPLNISSGYIHFGLFEGTWRLDSGYGERVEHKKILEVTYLDPTFLVKGLYNATIGCVTASLFFGIISALLAIVNTASNPTEPICHLPGLISYNGIAAIGLFGGVLTWVIQYFLKLRYNVLEREQRFKGEGPEQRKLWTSTGRAALGHSFWLIVIADGLFVLNVAILVLLEQKRRRRLRTLGGLDGADVSGGGGAPQNIYSGVGYGGGGGSIIGTSKKQHHATGETKQSGNLMLY